MAAEIQTPVCEATGLPLPILPTEPDERARFLFADYHHHFHPRRDPLLQEVDGRAVRYSRGQLVQRFLHNRYHQIFTGPPLPETPEEKFRTAVLACAGIVPRRAIDLSQPGEFSEVELDNTQYAELAAPRSIYVEKAFSIKAIEYERKRRAIGKFFAAYALDQDIGQAVSKNVLRQFLSDKTSPERKKELGNFILTETLGLSILPLTPVHQELSREGFVLPERRRSPRTVLRKFFTKENYPDYHETLTSRVAMLAP